MNKLIRLLRYDWPLHFVLLLTNWLPDNIAFLKLRGLFISHFVYKCGKNLLLGRNISIYNPINIELGNDVYIAYGNWFVAAEKIKIENEVMFGPYCVVVSGNHTKKNGSFRYGPPIDKPILVGSGTWIGSHVTVSAGAQIGPGCLVAANSAVTAGSIPPNSMVAGTPAKIIKSDI
jgi:acetyltransferase-like isoleucine patch superfamily enzyme